MLIDRQCTSPDSSLEIWLAGGVQLHEVPGAPFSAGSTHPLCLIVDELKATREKALSHGCSRLPKHHRVRLPDGLQIEMFTPLPGAVNALKQLSKQ